MKSIILAVVAMFGLTACAGHSIENYSTNVKQNWGDKAYNESHTLPGVQFKTVELYKFNMFGPSYSFMLLYQCDAKGANCVEAPRTPTTTPGAIAGLIAPAIQAGAIVGSAAILADGIRDSRSRTSNNNYNGSNSSSYNSNSNTNSNSAIGGNGGAGGVGGNGGNGGSGGNSSVNGTNNPGQGH